MRELPDALLRITLQPFCGLNALRPGVEFLLIGSWFFKRETGATPVLRRISRAEYPQAFQTCPGLVLIAAMALRVSTMHGDQSASS